MRAGLSTIQQTLTPEAATVLNQSIAEAGRRNHGQTTPLHVAATLLASPSGFLRQACIRSHPNSSHPLQCRALELCFSVALERLPMAQNAAAPAAEPPISNALMAALKRAQAHQRRGCPEQQQQPLLAVKVELEQLIISILDDPSVSRVMREASFSSPAVKAAVEQSLNNSGTTHAHLSNGNVGFAGIGPRILSNPSPTAATLPLVNRNIYLNPRLQQQGTTGLMGNHKDEEVKKLLEIMGRTKKRNPILVGDSEPRAVVQELLRKIENKDLGNHGRIFNNNIHVLSPEKDQMLAKIEELGDLIAKKMKTGGVILDLGDLKWLVEQPPPPAPVPAMTRLLEKFSGGDENGNKLLLIGTATCETYLRCQVYHPTIETDWDLQAVPIATRSPLQGLFPKLSVTQRMSTGPVESLKTLSMPRLPTSENTNPSLSRHFTPSFNSEPAGNSFSECDRNSTRPSLPQWLQSAKLDSKSTDESRGKKDDDLVLLQKKSKETCFDKIGLLSKSKSLGGESLRLDVNPPTSDSPVRTELALRSEPFEEDRAAKDFLGCISSEPPKKLHDDKFANASDADAYKKLLKALMEKAWWQPEAASAVASAVTRFTSRRSVSRGDAWLLFSGPDRVGKKKVASVLSEHICGTNPVVICLGRRRGDEEESNGNVRGKTAVDRISEAIRRNPFSVIVLEDIDEADVLVCGSIERAIQRGRLTDSHGREVALGNAMFVMTGDWSTADPQARRDRQFVDEDRLAAAASGSWQLGLIVRDKTAKRRANWPVDDEAKLTKPKTETRVGGLSLDLNLAASCYAEDDRADGSSFNSSDLTTDHDDERSDPHCTFFPSAVPRGLADGVDEWIAFKPVALAWARREIRRRISAAFAAVIGDRKVTIEIGDDVAEKILGGLWHDRGSLEEWMEGVVRPSFRRLKSEAAAAIGGDRSNAAVVRLVVESDCCDRGKRKGNAEWLPATILV